MTVPTIDQHYIQAYNRTATELAGWQFNSLLVPLLRQESDSGKIASFDGIGSNFDESDDGANETSFADFPSYADFIQSATGLFADYLPSRTPHNEVFKQRSLISPKAIDWGYDFREKDKIAELSDPTSRTLRQGSKNMRVSMDRYVLDALIAPTVLRGNNSEDATAIAFDTNQILTGTTAKKWTLEDGRRVKRQFEDNYVDDEENIIAIISPEMKESFFNEDGATISSRDFVDNYKYFRTMELPKIDGITYVVHPRMAKAAYIDGNYARVVAFTMEGMVWNKFSELTTDLDKNPDARFKYQAYMEMFANAVRVDDKRVTWTNIAAV